MACNCRYLGEGDVMQCGECQMREELAGLRKDKARLVTALTRIKTAGPSQTVKMLRLIAHHATMPHVDCPCWDSGVFKQVPCPWHNGKDKYPIGAPGTPRKR